MNINVSGHIPVTGDCGHKFEIPITGFEDEFECTVCGAKDRFNPDQIASIRAQIREQAAAFGVDHIRKELGKSLKQMAAGSKHLKYRGK